MRYLPTDDEQEWLLRGLAGILRARGSEPFLEAPIVEPTPEYFPDRVGSLPEALDRVTRRLMQYARLGGLEVQIEPFEGGALEAGDERAPCRRIAGCFLGIADGCCRFGINADLPPEIEDLAGVMAHEVAHAYRAYHQLCSDDEMEEPLTDLTAAYLGFGILSLNNSYRFRKSGSFGAGVAVTSWSTSAMGYLTPQAHAFLLAAQLVSRGFEPERRQSAYRHLEANQAAFVKAAVKQLEEDDAALRTTLGIGPAAAGAAVRTPAEILAPLKAYAPPEPSSEAAEEPVPWNRGRPVFRIRQSRMLEMCVVGPTILGFVGLVAGLASFRTWLGVVPFGLLGLVLGVRQGRRTRRDVCSDSSCQAVLDSASTNCPRCGGEIVGYIASPEDRLEMEERTRAARRRSAQSRSPSVDVGASSGPSSAAGPEEPPRGR